MTPEVFFCKDHGDIVIIWTWGSEKADRDEVEQTSGLVLFEISGSCMQSGESLIHNAHRRTKRGRLECIEKALRTGAIPKNNDVD